MSTGTRSNLKNRTRNVKKEKSTKTLRGIVLEDLGIKWIWDLERIGKGWREGQGEWPAVFSFTSLCIKIISCTLDCRWKEIF